MKVVKGLDSFIRHLKPYTLNLKPVANRGFTLLEILIAIFILVLVVSAVFGAFSGTFKVVTETEIQGEIYATARVTLERISEDLASVYVGALTKTDQPEAGAARQRFLFVGEDHRMDEQSADTLRFLSWAHVSFKNGRQAQGPAEINYYTQYDEETGELTLYRADTLDYLESPEEGQGGLLLCEGLKWLDFIYYDREGDTHNSWDTTENSSNAQLPSRVEISMGFENALDPKNPLQFMTGVALP